MPAPSCQALTVLLLLMGSLTASAQDSAFEVHQRAPPFTVMDHLGRSLSLADCTGDATLLFFHSEGMDYSRQLVEQLAQELHGHPEVHERTVLLVVARGDADMATLEQRLERGETPYRIIPDPEGLGVPGYGVVAYPTVFCIGPQGEFTDVVRGYGPLSASRIVAAARFALGELDAGQFERIQLGLSESPDEVADPGLARTLTMADKLVVSGQLESATQTLQGLGARLRGSSRGLALLARVLLLQGRAEEAHGPLETLAALDPEGEIRVLKIRLQIMEGELDRARAELDHLPGDLVETRLLRGMLLESQERWQDAALLYRQLLERLIREHR